MNRRIRICLRFAIWTAIACSIIVSHVTSVYANGGAVSWPPTGQGPLRFDAESGISLAREKIVYEIDRERYDMARVGVEYVLRNGDDQRKDIDLLFITPSFPEEEFHAREGGTALATKAIANVTLDNWTRREPAEEAVEPLSGSVLRYRDRAGTRASWPVTGYSFRLSFAPGEEKTVTMDYADYGGFHRIGLMQPIHSFLYYMTPASLWEGETAVELVLRLPDRKFRVHSSIPLAKQNGTEYGAKLRTLPEEEWRLSIVDASGLIYGTNSSLIHNLVSLFLVLAATGGLLFAALRRKQPVILAAGAPVLLVFTYFSVRSVSSHYAVDFVAVWAIRAAVAGLLAICWLAAYMRVRRKAAETAKNGQKQA